MTNVPIYMMGTLVVKMLNKEEARICLSKNVPLLSKYLFKSVLIINQKILILIKNWRCYLHYIDISTLLFCYTKSKTKGFQLSSYYHKKLNQFSISVFFRKKVHVSFLTSF